MPFCLVRPPVQNVERDMQRAIHEKEDKATVLRRELTDDKAETIRTLQAEHAAQVCVCVFVCVCVCVHPLFPPLRLRECVCMQTASLFPPPRWRDD